MQDQANPVVTETNSTSSLLLEVSSKTNIGAIVVAVVVSGAIFGSLGYYLAKNSLTQPVTTNNETSERVESTPVVTIIPESNVTASQTEEEIMSVSFDSNGTWKLTDENNNTPTIVPSFNSDKTSFSAVVDDYTFTGTNLETGKTIGNIFIGNIVLSLSWNVLTKNASTEFLLAQNGHSMIFKNLSQIKDLEVEFFILLEDKSERTINLSFNNVNNQNEIKLSLSDTGILINPTSEDLSYQVMFTQNSNTKSVSSGEIKTKILTKPATSILNIEPHDWKNLTLGLKDT